MTVRNRTGVDDAAASRNGDAEMSEAQASALEAKIEAAQRRGDFAELRRLAIQARAAADAATPRAEQAGAKGELGLWQAPECVHGEIAQAACRLSDSFGASPCLRCTLPQSTGR